MQLTSFVGHNGNRCIGTGTFGIKYLQPYSILCIRFQVLNNMSLKLKFSGSTLIVENSTSHRNFNEYIALKLTSIFRLRM